MQGTEKPLAYASRTLNKTEKNNTMIDKEASYITFGVKKHHQYLASKQFKYITHHKHLIRLFDLVKKVPDTL